MPSYLGVQRAEQHAGHLPLPVLAVERQDQQAIHKVVQHLRRAQVLQRGGHLLHVAAREILLDDRGHLRRGGAFRGSRS